MKRFLSLVLAVSLALAPVAWAGGAGHQLVGKPLVKWNKMGTVDSTAVTNVLAGVDTTNAIPLRQYMPEFTRLTGATDSTQVLIGRLAWTNVSGDSMYCTVQFSHDNSTWTSERTYVVVNAYTPFPLYRWHNTSASMDVAQYVRVILLHNDVTSPIVKSFSLSPVVFTEGQ